MTYLYDKIHDLFNSKKRFHFPFDVDLDQIPQNGVYIIFEKGEQYKQYDRIVRVGTHKGNNQLRSRLYQHFVLPNKNRSIFRKNIGRALLNKDSNPYLRIWELDTTSRADKIKNTPLINMTFEQELEGQISKYIQHNLSFVVFRVNTKDKRFFWESRLISTLAAFHDIRPSDNWLGLFSPKDKIRQYGLWQVNELKKKPLDNDEFNELTQILE
jgi:hypothetical protein